MPVKRKLTRKKKRTAPLRKWTQKAKNKSGGFAFIIAALIAAGISAANAAAAASLVTAAATGVATATGAYVATKVLKSVGGSKTRPKLTHRSGRHRLR